MFLFGAALTQAETADDARLRQLAGQAASYAGEVRSLLAKGADPNVPDRDGRTAVHGAAAISAAETMQALLAAGGNPNRRDKDGNTPLHLANAAPLLSGAVATIRLLLGAEADPGIANGEGRTALHAAVGPNPGWPGWDGAGLPGIVRVLLAGGADPRLTNGDGLPVLQRFVREGTGSGETASLLIEAGADPNRKYANGEAPLHAAIRTGGTRGKVAVAEALLAGGADPCIRDAQGFIPYSVATQGGPIHRALDRAGAYELACDRQGEAVALDSSERRRVQEALARAGFDPGPADGKFGPRTRRAIEGWQQANGYAATGELTSGQVEALLADAAALKPFGSNWIIAENQPCQLYNPSPKPGETVTWSGDCVDGKASGEGRVVWRGSYGESVYEGGYRDGKTHGHGIYTREDGLRYEGELRDGKPHGHATVSFVNGDGYEGEWRDGKRHGHGTYTWATGGRYEGEFREGEFHGRGTRTYSDGSGGTCQWRDGEVIAETCEYH